MTENEKNFWLDGEDGLKPYLRLKDKGMPQRKIEQIAWLLLNGSGCGFCKVCRDKPCKIKDGEGCTDNIAKYIRETVLNEVESEIQQYRAIGTVEECRESMERQRAKKYKIIEPCKSVIYYQCPCCNGLLYINENFCGECGQAILWEEE